MLLQPDLYRIPNAEMRLNNKNKKQQNSIIRNINNRSRISPKLALTWRTVKSLLLVVQLSKCMAHWDDTNFSFNIMLCYVKISTFYTITTNRSMDIIT